MNKIYDVFLPGVPPKGTAQQRRINFKTGHTYMPASVKMAQKQLADALKPTLPEKPFEGALKVIEKWYYPIPKSYVKGNRSIIKKETTPDVDNLAKLLNDALKGSENVILDDKYIYSLTVEKYYVNPSLHQVGIHIVIYR